jgi:AhpD family alkylhydroperoxidase
MQASVMMAMPVMTASSSPSSGRGGYRLGGATNSTDLAWEVLANKRGPDMTGRSFGNPIDIPADRACGDDHPSPPGSLTLTILTIVSPSLTTMTAPPYRTGYARPKSTDDRVLPMICSREWTQPHRRCPSDQRSRRMANKEVLHELRRPVKDLREHIPAMFEGYGALNGAVFAIGTLDAKTKALNALAVAVSKQCDGCMASHASGAAGRGPTAEQVADVLCVAILMNGGPGTVHAPGACEAVANK